MGVDIHEKNPTIGDFEKIVSYANNYVEAYERDEKLKRKGRDSLKLSKPKEITTCKALLHKFKELKKSVNYSEELQAMHTLVERIGKYPRLFDYNNKSKDDREKFKRQEKSYEDKYADKKTRRLINIASLLEDNKKYSIEKKIKNTKIKNSLHLLHDYARGMSALILKERKKVFDRNYEYLFSNVYEKMKDTLAEKMANYNPHGKGQKIYNKYDWKDDERNHDSRIEKARSLSGKDEKTLGSIYSLVIPSKIRDGFTEKDLKVFDAYSKKMREAIEKVKEFNIETEEYKIAIERAQDAKVELTEMYSIPKKMKDRIRNSIKAHETKLIKSKRKLKEKQEKYEEKTGIKKELGRVGHYKKLLELHQKYAGVTITEEMRAEEGECYSRIFSNESKMKNLIIRANYEEREKIESELRSDRAKLQEFREMREGLEEYKRLMKDFVEDTIARARGKDKITTKALPAGNVEAKEQDNKEEKSNIDIFRENMNKSMEARRARESSLRERKQNAREEKAKKDEKSNDVGEIE